MSAKAAILVNIKQVTLSRCFGVAILCMLSGVLYPTVLTKNAFAAEASEAKGKDVVAKTESLTAELPKAVGFTEAQTRRILAHTPWPIDAPPDPGNEFSGIPWAEALGQRLFNDPGLSANGTIACATCHQAQNGFVDGLRVAQGAGTHVRNTQGLLDVALQRWFGWDGGADSLWAASLRPMMSSIEMGATVESAARYLRGSSYFFSSLNSSTQVSNPQQLNDEELVVMAAKLIGSYIRTLRSGRTPFDLYTQAVIAGDEAAQANYSPQARHGLDLFIGEGNCQTCHFGPNFSNGEFHDTGRPFFTASGQVDSGRYSGIVRVREDPYQLAGEYNGTAIDNEIRKTRSVTLSQSNFGQWKTPSLRNLALTAPYMHDGSLATLHDVVNAYANIDPERLHSNGEAILKPMAWDKQDIDALVVFLNSLSPN